MYPLPRVGSACRARRGEDAKLPHRRRSSQQASVGPKTRSAGQGPASPRSRRSSRVPDAARGNGGAVDLVLKGRGVRITDRIRKVAEHKLEKLGRIDPRVTRLEVEIIERNPRLGGSHHI